MMSKEDIEKMIQQHHLQNIAERTIILPTTSEERNENNITVVTSEDSYQGRPRSDSLTTVNSNDSHEEFNFLGTTTTSTPITTSWTSYAEGTNSQSVFRSNIQTNTANSLRRHEDSTLTFTDSTGIYVPNIGTEYNFNNITSYEEGEDEEEDDGASLYIGYSSIGTTKHCFTNGRNIALLDSFDLDGDDFVVDHYEENLCVVPQQTNNDIVFDYDATTIDHIENTKFRNLTQRFSTDCEAIKSNKLVENKKVVVFNKKRTTKDNSKVTKSCKKVLLFKKKCSNKDHKAINPRVLFKSEKVVVLEKQYTNQDILCGRGAKLNKHPGNVRFREFAKQFRCEYKATKSKILKRKIADKFLKMAKGDGAKVLRLCNGIYTKVDPDDELTKAQQVLRESPEDGAKKREKAKNENMKKRK